MERYLLLLQQARVRRIAHQRVLERITQHCGRATANQESRINQPIQLLPELLFRQVHQLGEKLIGKFPADHRADLGNCLRGSQPVQARHEGVVERRRDCEKRVATFRGAVLAFPQVCALEHVAGEILDE